MTLRWLTAGESHGPSLVAILEGLPAHVSVTSDDIRGRAGPPPARLRPRRPDEVRAGRGHASSAGSGTASTQGGPVAIQIGNTEWPKWETVMSADPVDPAVLEGSARNAPLTRPRPGHADLAGMQKYAFDEARPVLERASARETAARVALGRVASQLPRAGGRRPDRLPRHRARRRTRAGRPVARAGRRGPARRGPGALPRPRHRQADGRADRPGPRGRRHPRRRRRGGGARAAARPRLARALGPAARLAAGRRADGHPGDQGRRGRRRLRAGRHAGLAGARRDGPDRRRASAG